MSHEGAHLYRLKHNPMEQLFHDEWKHRNDLGHALEYLMGDGNDRAAISARDEKVAATVMQWLGSPVGQSFLEEVKDKSSGVVTLDKFITQEERRIMLFRKWWILQNAENPEHFPMEMPVENAGVWNEMLDGFDPDKPETPR